MNELLRTQLRTGKREESQRSPGPGWGSEVGGRGDSRPDPKGLAGPAGACGVRPGEWKFEEERPNVTDGDVKRPGEGRGGIWEVRVGPRQRQPGPQ